MYGSGGEKSFSSTTKTYIPLLQLVRSLCRSLLAFSKYQMHLRETQEVPIDFLHVGAHSELSFY